MLCQQALLPVAQFTVTGALRLPVLLLFFQGGAAPLQLCHLGGMHAVELCVLLCQGRQAGGVLLSLLLQPGQFHLGALSFQTGGICPLGQDEHCHKKAQSTTDKT